MYNTMKRLYAKTHDKSILEKAVARGWISADEMTQIISEVGE